MSFLKGGLDGQVDKVVDQAATAVKGSVNSMLKGAGGGGGEGAKTKSQGGGIGEKVTGAINKAASDAVKDKAAEQAMNIVKKNLG